MKLVDTANRSRYMPPPPLVSVVEVVMLPVVVVALPMHIVKGPFDDTLNWKHASMGTVGGASVCFVRTRKDAN